MNKILIASMLSLIVLFAGCTKAPAGTTAPSVTSGNVESASSTAESASENFVNDATPTPDQEVPDLT